jgi:ankyrin repeat protein
MIAANNNNLDMVKVLLNAKAEVNVQTEVSESDGVYLIKYVINI